MGNKSSSLPDRITEDQAKELAGELWNQYIFDSIVGEDGLADKNDVIDSASEALMAFQGESVEIMRVTARRKKSVAKTYKTNQEFARSVYESKKSKKSGPKLEICQLAHMGQLDDLMSLCALAEASTLDSLDSKLDKTALQIASMYGFVDICKFLIEKGCSVDMQNREKKTAMHLAAQVGNWEIVTLLASSGASTDVKDTLGRFPGDYVESDYSCEGFVKQDTSRMEEMKSLLVPRNPQNRLYQGPRKGKQNDPPAADVVAVEISQDSFQVAESGVQLSRLSRSVKSNGSTRSSRNIIGAAVVDPIAVDSS